MSVAVGEPPGAVTGALGQGPTGGADALLEALRHPDRYAKASALALPLAEIAGDLASLELSCL